MIRFSNFLTEKRQAQEKLKNVEDAKGKLFEILAGSYLLHGKHPKTGMPNKFLEHYRDEDGFRPQEVHDKIKDALDTLSPGMYEQVLKHSHDAAQHLTGELQKRGYNNINNLAWTSQKGDHERFTGVDDPNSDADLMLKGSNSKGKILDPAGLSMKYGKQKDPNLRGNGLDALEQIAGLKKGDLEGLRDAHYNHIRKNGIQSGVSGDAQYKALSAQNHPTAQAIDDHAIGTQKEMSRRFTEGLGKKSSEDLRNAIRGIIAPETKYLHMRHHTQVGNDGNANHETHNIQDHANKILDDYEEFRVRPHTGGISTVIEGKRKGANDFERAMEIGMKKTRTFSGRGFNSFTKAPMLREGRKTKNKKTTAIDALASAIQAARKAPKPKPAPAPEAPLVSNRPSPGGFGEYRGNGPDVGKLPRVSEFGGKKF